MNAPGPDLPPDPTAKPPLPAWVRLLAGAAAGIVLYWFVQLANFLFLIGPIAKFSNEHGFYNPGALQLFWIIPILVALSWPAIRKDRIFGAAMLVTSVGNCLVKECPMFLFYLYEHAHGYA